tara:strand:+ start:1085 stop:1852 length:768 start_codon:yes stop_codon:yes gene_type:complete
MEKIKQINFLGPTGVGKTTIIKKCLDIKRYHNGYLKVNDNEIRLRPRFNFDFLNNNRIKSILFRKSKIKSLFYKNFSIKRSIYNFIETSNEDSFFLKKLVENLGKQNKISITNINLIHQIVYNLYYKRNFIIKNQILYSENNFMLNYLSLISEFENYKDFINEIDFSIFKKDIFIYLTNSLDEIYSRYIKRNMKIIRLYNKSEQEIRDYISSRIDFDNNMLNYLKNFISIHIVESNSYAVENINRILDKKYTDIK